MLFEINFGIVCAVCNAICHEAYLIFKRGRDVVEFYGLCISNALIDLIYKGKIACNIGYDAI